MKSFLLFFAAAISISIISAAERRYPQDALECFASSALQSQKDGQIICPLSSNVCIKEIINATRAQCGKTNGLYLGRDVWDVRLAKCVYRKCGLTCPNTVETTFREENLEVESNATQIFSSVQSSRQKKQISLWACVGVVHIVLHCICFLTDKQDWP